VGGLNKAIRDEETSRFSHLTAGSLELWLVSRFIAGYTSDAFI
jgi:hypothetical protein